MLEGGRSFLFAVRNALEMTFLGWWRKTYESMKDTGIAMKHFHCRILNKFMSMEIEVLQVLHLIQKLFLRESIGIIVIISASFKEGHD